MANCIDATKSLGVQQQGRGQLTYRVTGALEVSDVDNGRRLRRVLDLARHGGCCSQWPAWYVGCAVWIGDF